MKKKTLYYLFAYDKAIIDCIDAVMTNINYSADREKAVGAILTMIKQTDEKEEPAESTEEAKNNASDM